MARLALLAMAGMAWGGAALAAEPGFSEEQASRGKAAYQADCAECHGPNLNDGQFAGALKGAPFRERWGGKPLTEPFTVMSTMMPPANPGGLGPEAYADILAYLLQQNGLKPDGKPLPNEPKALQAMVMPK
jgi:mono/diheme cytochrome c family protein